MSPIRDSDLMLRQTSDGDLTADANLTVKELEGTPMEGLALRVSCPTAFTGTSPSLTVVVRSSTSTTAPTTATTRIIGQKKIDAYGDYIIPFVDPHARAILVELDVAGTSPHIGAIEVAIINKNLGMEWTRAVNFH